MTTFRTRESDALFRMASCLSIGFILRSGIVLGVRAALLCSVLGVSLASAGGLHLSEDPPRLSEGIGVAGLGPRAAAFAMGPGRSSGGIYAAQRRAGNIMVATGLVAGLVVGPTLMVVGLDLLFTNDLPFLLGAGLTLAGLVVAIIGSVVVSSTPRRRSARSRMRVQVAPSLEKRSRGVALLGRF